MSLATDPLWYKNAIFYELHIRAFADSNGDGKGDLLGIIPKLDYLKELGVDCIWLLPMFPSPLKDDGYDIADYYNIHPDYGTVEDFKKLVDEAHARGLRVITDLVLNHTSDQHAWFIESRKSKDNPYRDYYVWSDTDQKYQETRIIFLDTEPSNWTYDETTGQYYWHRFYASQPDLNYDNPVVADTMIEVLKYWMDMGIDGFRADAVPYLFEREGTNCENLPETHAYLKRVRAVLDADYPGTILLGEANQWPWDLRPYFGGNPDDPEMPGDEFHMAFHFPVMPRIYKALKLGDASDIIQIMADTPAIPSNSQWCVFLRNHDELTLEMVTEEDRQLLWQLYAPDPRMRLNLGIRRRLAPLLDNNRAKIELANSILFTLPGAPIIYYGDEIGMGDNIWLFDRNGVRTPMQWTSEPGAGFSAAAPETFYAPLIDDETYGYQKINVAAQMADPASLFHTLKHMVAVRKANPVLGEGSYQFLRTGNKAILANLRQSDQAAILAIHNLSGQNQTAVLDLSDFAGRIPRDLLGRLATSLPEISTVPYSVSVKPLDYFWLKLK
ncbi:MAG: maltose alpha-D-glucosyltransferase [Anaerolineae bacterium]|nr:maltose alpha-D-glucosyltransferase [Anaerolineales bacterium]MCQ3977499.1 maltose alpha-D-glucosyltransferase [Anaerolineae bacterium]